MTSFEEQLKESLSNAYDIERELGGGGMSRVFVATDRLLGRKVVVKVLSPELTAEVNRGRFRREIQVAAQLQHPHIVTLFAAGEHNDLVYYTMPFIEGESLKSALEREGRLAVPDVIRVLYDVVDALSYAHRHGVIHRDIKPANILRSGSHALVTDFGVAKALNAAMGSSGAMTSTGMAIGTPAYMSPEQLAGDPLADHRIDIYALGLLSYELLTGQSPFAAPSPQAVLAAVLTRDPKPLYEVRKDVPRKLSNIIMTCLSKMPGGRPPDAEALLDSLDMIATSSGEIRTREHKVPRQRHTPIVIPVLPSTPGPVSTPTAVMTTAPEPVPMPTLSPTPNQTPAVAPIVFPTPVQTTSPGYVTAPEPVKGRGRMVAGLIAAALVIGAGVVYASQKMGSKSPTVATATPNTEVSPAAIAPIDSAAIAASVNKRIADAAAAAAANTGAAAVNTDSIRKKIQKEIGDSIAKANAARTAALAFASPAASQKMAAANGAEPDAKSPAAPAAAPTAPPVVAVAPAAAPTSPPPAVSGKKRLAITSPRENSNPQLNAFTRAFIGALRATLDQNEAFDAIDQDEVRDAQAKTGSRDEAAKVLRPDVMVWPGYNGTGDTVQVVVTVWDLRSSSSYGIRVTTARLVASDPDRFIAPLVQSTMKQLNDLSNMPTIYRRK